MLPSSQGFWRAVAEAEEEQSCVGRVGHRAAYSTLHPHTWGQAQGGAPGTKWGAATSCLSGFIQKENSCSQAPPVCAQVSLFL